MKNHSHENNKTLSQSVIAISRLLSVQHKLSSHYLTKYGPRKPNMVQTPIVTCAYRTGTTSVLQNKYNAKSTKLRVDMTIFSFP